MYQNIYPFGHVVFGDTIGEVWANLVAAILRDGEYSLDEGRKRKALQSVMLKSNHQTLPDEIITRFGDKRNLDHLINLTFSEEVMWDFDVKPSFPPGSKSYYARLKESQGIEFVIKRLTRFPESKKAVIVFPIWEDYTAVLENPEDDYLPCIVSIQYRMLKKNGNYQLTTLVYARSLDAFQKGYANLWVICMISQRIQAELIKSLGKTIELGPLSMWVADAHIYGETEKEAERFIKNIKGDVCAY